MLNQQLKFAFTFIGLGALLGWFSNTAYNNVSNKVSNSGITQAEITRSKISDTKPVVSIQQEEPHSKINQFAELIADKQYDNALLLYKDAEPEKQTKLFSILLLEINQLNKKSDPGVFNLLDVFLQEYYNNTQLLLIKADALILKNKPEQALDSFLLARYYAQDNNDHILISKKIHGFARIIYEEFERKNEWSKSVSFFKKLIENEPDSPYYHLSLAESYIKSGDTGMAVASLQWIKDDVIYGKKAVELLDMITLNQLPQGVELKKRGDQYVTNSTLSDFYEVRLLIDTGASYSSLPSYIIAQLAREYQAEKVGHNRIYTASGIVDADIYKLKKMSIGGFSVNDIIVAELDLESSQDINNDFEGLLGMNFLSHFDFSIDQKLNQLFLTPKLDRGF